MSETTKKQKILTDLGLAGTYTGIENRISELPIEVPDLTPVTLEGRFFYLSFRNKRPTVEEFVEFIYPKIIPFCIPRAKRNENYQKFRETGDDRYYVELIDRAKNLFIKALKTLKRSGESGELILFTLLESFFNSPQIACKMYLKTSERMAVHGSDSIHGKYDPKTDELTLLWGESKLYQRLSSSLDEICKSIAQFNERRDGRTPRERDIDIIKDHGNIEDPAIRKAFLEYFDPYTPQCNKRKEAYCCLSGFNFSQYEDIQNSNNPEILKLFQDSYAKCINDACMQFKDKIIKNGIDNLSFILILLPFKSIAEFRELFYAKLGISVDT